MSKTLVSEITIAAPANAVWEVLTDFAAYRGGTRSSSKPPVRRGSGTN